MLQIWIIIRIVIWPKNKRKSDGNRYFIIVSHCTYQAFPGTNSQRGASTPSISFRNVDKATADNRLIKWALS